MKNVLLTGASAGIGRALAFELAERGHNLALLARRKPLLDELAAEIQARFKVQIYVGVADVTDDEAMRTAIAGARAALGPIDTVIANAGFGIVGNIDRITLDDVKRQFDTNVYGVFRTLYPTLDDLKATHGRLCLVGSAMSYLTLPGSTPYSMSKYAVRSLAEGLQAELAPHGVSVTLINPGFIDTEIRRVDRDGKMAHKDPVPPWLQMPAPTAARKIYRAIRSRKRERALTGHAYLGIWASRFIPSILAAFGRLVAHRSERPAQV